MLKVNNYLKLMRIKHYLKNVLLLLPIFFSGNMLSEQYLFVGLLGFICFSFTSSVIYIINDIVDVENDRKHPVKKNRPLAAGIVSIKEAIVIIVLLILVVFTINLFILNKNFSWVWLILYLFINILYCFLLKNKPVIDVFTLSLGFLIRVLYGGALLNIAISSWLFLTILCGALFMSNGKRKKELLKNGIDSRMVLKYYNVEFLDKCMYMFLTMTLTFYSLWTVDVNNKYLIYSIPVLILICLFYNYDINQKDSYGDPIDTIFRDKRIMLLLLLLLIILILSIYIFPLTI